MLPGIHIASASTYLNDRHDMFFYMCIKILKREKNLCACIWNRLKMDSIFFVLAQKVIITYDYISKWNSFQVFSCGQFIYF